jgi:antitoxin component YwqK of YwqJK toxin-antitoxin module
MSRVNTDDIEFTDDYRYMWNGLPFSGIGFDAGEDGTLLSEMEFREGILDGMARDFYPSGCVKSESQYRNNTLDGTVREWSQEGILQRVETYERGICIRRQVRDESGQLTLNYELDENDPQFELLQMLRRTRFSELC